MIAAIPPNPLQSGSNSSAIDVRIAYDGYHTIDLARRQQPDYVLFDLGLPRLDGYRVASWLRQELERPLVVIVITGNGPAEDRRRALAAGCESLFPQHTFHIRPATPPN